MAGVPVQPTNNTISSSGSGMGLVGPIAGLIGQGMAAHQANKANKEARGFAMLQGDIEWNRNLLAWAMQHQQSVKDWNMQNQYNERIWNMQNEYNSPAAQMARYKEAGLNPNLIYGQSNTGGSFNTADLKSGNAPAGTRPGNYIPRVPEFDFQNGIMSYFQARESAARTNNLEATNRAINQDVILKTIKAAEMSEDVEGKKMKNFWNKTLLPLSAEGLEANIRKIKAETQIGLNRDTREKAMTASQLSLQRQELLNKMGQQKNMELDNAIKQKQLELLEMGIQPHDNVLMRYLQRGINGLDKLPKWNGKILPGNWDEKAQTYYFNNWKK